MVHHATLSYTGLVSREERAQRRRAHWNSEIVDANSPKGRLYDGLSIEERLAAFTRLNERTWASTGGSTAVRTPRDEWPVEVFEIQKRG